MTFKAPGTFFKDSDGFGRPNYGGDVAVKYGSFDFEDTTAKTLFTLPTGAVIVDFARLVTVAFDDTGTDLADIGIEGNGDYFFNDTDVAATGLVRAGAATSDPLVLLGTPLAADTDVTAQFTGSNADAAAGQATFVVWYVLR